MQGGWRTRALPVKSGLPTIPPLRRPGCSPVTGPAHGARGYSPTTDQTSPIETKKPVKRAISAMPP
jgi:hypothetical protein